MSLSVLGLELCTITPCKGLVNLRNMESEFRIAGRFSSLRLLTQLFLPTSPIPGSLAGFFLCRKKQQDLPKYLAVYTLRQSSTVTLGGLGYRAETIQARLGFLEATDRSGVKMKLHRGRRREAVGGKWQ